jgi:allantoate deiminase
MGLDLLENIIATKTKLPFHIELIGFCDEEGCRYHTTYLGSKAVAGLFHNSLLDLKDATGISLREAVSEQGGDCEKIAAAILPAGEWLGYFEIHIEQGPVLYENKIPVALVTAIAGQCRINIIMKGEAGHAGTVPMNMRKDALACAASVIISVEKYALAHKDKLVATVGKLNIPHSASNVIPGEVTFTLDVRSADEEVLVAACTTIQKLVDDICTERNIDWEWTVVQQAQPVLCDEQLNRSLSSAIDNAGHEVIRLVSGAGHDAVPVSSVAPVTMLFVRCFKGISHNPLENVEEEDIAAAIEVCDQFIHTLMVANGGEWSRMRE